MKYIKLLLTAIIFSACSTINPAIDGTLYYTSENFSATLTSTGYGKNSNLLEKYSGGDFSSIFQNNENSFTFNTNTIDSTGSSTNSITITIEFPAITNVKNILTNINSNIEKPSISVKKFKDETTTSETVSLPSYQTDTDFNIIIEENIKKLEITFSLSKYNSQEPANSYISIYKLIPQF